LAKAHRVPAYVILHDATLEALCRHQPRTMQDLLGVPGIGEKRAEKYGGEILKLLSS
jgi:ATP-dependent DNA helicase RecQ